MLKGKCLLVGIAGPKRSGKSTLKEALWKALHERSDTQQVLYRPLAMPLKRAICELVGVPLAATLATADKEEIIACGSIVDGLPLRKLFQFFGTEAMRESFGAALVREGVWSPEQARDFWIRVNERVILRSIASEARLGETEAILPRSVVIVDDVRFHNEARWVRDQGGFLIRLEGGVSGDSHASEMEVNELDADLIIAAPGPDGWSSVQASRAAAVEVVLRLARLFFGGQGAHPFTERMANADILKLRS